MSGQGCQLLISPCSLIKGHQSQSIRFPITSQRTSQSPNSSIDKLHKQASRNSAATGQRHSPLPPLSLRRQVLTNGRNAALPGTSVQEERASNYKASFSVSGPSIQVFGHTAGASLTAGPPLISSQLYPDTHPPPYPAGVPAPHSDARSLFSRESLASTTLSQFETQSVFSSKHDWPYGYRVLPPLGPAASSTQVTSEGSEQISNPPETALSGTTISGGTSTSLPSYLFAVDVTSPKQPCSKKRALSISPLSDVIGIDFNSIIRTSPTSLVAYINGARSSPSSHPTVSPAHSDSYGHFLGIRGCSIPQTQPYINTTQDSPQAVAVNNEHDQIRNLELGSGLESQMANMMVEQQCLAEREGIDSKSHTSPNLVPFRSSNPVAHTTIHELETPLGPPPPYHSHQYIYKRHKQYSDSYIQNPGAPFRHGLSFLPQVPMLEEEEGEVEVEEYGGHLCRWIDCSAVYDLKDELVKHIEKLHVDQRKAEDFTCYWERCPRNLKPFNARYKLLIHMRVHSGEKPNKCTFEGCKKAFSRLENLKIHLRSHTGEKPYVCSHPDCHKAFSNSSDRAKHQRTHLDTKPYACQVPGCAKRYTDPSSLRKHIKSHSTKEQHLRKKMKSAVDTGPDPLTGCLTIQSLQPSLSPSTKKDGRLHPPASCSSHSAVSAAPQGQNSPGNSHLQPLHYLPDNYRFVDRSLHQLFPGDQSGPSTCSSLPPTVTSLLNSQDLKQSYLSPSPLKHSAELAKQMDLLLCSSQYEEMATHTTLSHLMQVDAFGDSSPAVNDPIGAGASLIAPSDMIGNGSVF